jgi:hypothetical protein
VRRRAWSSVANWRFRNRGIEYFSESGINWMSGSAKRECDRALAVPFESKGGLLKVSQLRHSIGTPVSASAMLCQRGCAAWQRSGLTIRAGNRRFWL